MSETTETTDSAKTPRERSGRPAEPISAEERVERRAARAEREQKRAQKEVREQQRASRDKRKGGRAPAETTEVGA